MYFKQSNEALQFLTLNLEQLLLTIIIINLIPVWKISFCEKKKMVISMVDNQTSHGISLFSEYHVKILCYGGPRTNKIGLYIESDIGAFSMLSWSPIDMIIISVFTTNESSNCVCFGCHIWYPSSIASFARYSRQSVKNDDSCWWDA